MTHDMHLCDKKSLKNGKNRFFVDSGVPPCEGPLTPSKMSTKSNFFAKFSGPAPCTPKFSPRRAPSCTPLERLRTGFINTLFGLMIAPKKRGYLEISHFLSSQNRKKSKISSFFSIFEPENRVLSSFAYKQASKKWVSEPFFDRF